MSEKQSVESLRESLTNQESYRAENKAESGDCESHPYATLQGDIPERCFGKPIMAAHGNRCEDFGVPPRTARYEMRPVE